MTTDLPRDTDGHINTSAEFGEDYMVRIVWSTDPEGNPVDEDDNSNETFHGTFASQQEAADWVNAYPEFEEIRDIYVWNINRVRPRTS
jgi:hypothetical protein